MTDFFVCPNRTTGGSPGPRREGERPGCVKKEEKVKVKADVLKNPVISQCHSEECGSCVR